MLNLERKTVITSIQGIGNLELSLLKIGKESWLKEIEAFITQSEMSFTVIACQKRELQNPLFMQRVIQAFINHIQAGGEEQKSNMIRNHFKNWLYKQNENLKDIIYGEQQQNADGSEQTLRDSVKAEFARRFGNGK